MKAKALFLIVLLTLVASDVMGQGTIDREKKCPTCGKLISKCPYKGKHNNNTAPKTYPVYITSNALSATLYVNGQYMGELNQTVKLKPGSYSVKVIADGYENFYKTLIVEKKEQTFHCHLSSIDVQTMCERGNACFDQSDYRQAVKWYRMAAERGNATAQTNLGYCYKTGKGVDKDAEQAVKWYRKAADQGNETAQNNLGVCYQYGIGVSQNYTEAARWFRMSAENGYVLGQYNLGSCYENGEGVEKDRSAAIMWYRMAASQGDVDAQNQLSKMGVTTW